MTAPPSPAEEHPEQPAAPRPSEKPLDIPDDLRPSGPQPSWKLWLGGLAALIAVYFFIAGIDTMGHGLKTVAKVPESKKVMDDIYHLADYPLAGLCVGVLLTSLVQSSSFTTSFTVALVAAGQMPLGTAIFVIMGANIGTSVTNTLVSLAHLRRRTEFQRSLHAATVHDFFNVLSVLLMLPLEWGFQVVSQPAHWLSDQVEKLIFSTPENFQSTNIKQFNFVKAAVEPIGDFFDFLLGDLIGMAPTARGLVTAGLATLILFAALAVLVKVLRSLMKDRLAGVFSRTIFRSQPISFVVGLFTTIAVQSSSVTTSLVVPLVGAGVLKTRQVFPYTLGANIGTTVTALLAGLAASAMVATSSQPALQAAAAAGLAVAFAHLSFNIYGTAIFWPLQWIPLGLSHSFAKMATRRRYLAAVYIIVVFFVVPILVIWLSNAFGAAGPASTTNPATSGPATAMAIGV